MKFFLYDTNANLIDIKAQAISAEVDQELAKYDEFVATFAKNESNTNDFKIVDKIGVPVDGQLELFKVTKPEISDSQITVSGIESASDDLAHQSYMLASSNDNLSLSQALQMVFDGTTWSVDLQAPDSVAGIDFSLGTKQDALEQVLETYQVEAYFTYSATTSHITGQTVHIVTKRGIDTHKRLVKGVNVSSFTYSRDLSSVVTGAYATGATPQNNDADTDNTDDSNTTNQDNQETPPYSLADSSWSVANGDPMDHAKGDPTLILQDATQKYGYIASNGSRLPRMVTLSYANDDPQQLIKHVYDYLLIHSQPELTLTATVYQLQSASLGDRFIAIDRDDGILDASIRAIKIQRNLLNDNLTVVTLGNYMIPTPAERQKQQEQQTKQAESKAKEAKEKAEKAQKEAKQAKEKADDVDKGLKDYKDSETKRRTAKAKEHAARHAAREQADAARDAKIAQNAKDIDNIKKGGTGTGDFSKLDGLITLEFEKDSKTNVKTINVHNKDKSEWVIQNTGMFWKDPDAAQKDSKKKQDEIDDENAQLKMPLIDQEGVLRPPTIEITGTNATSHYGQINTGDFGFTVNTLDNKSGFMIDASGENGKDFSILAKAGDSIAHIDKTGTAIAGIFEVDGNGLNTDITGTVPTGSFRIGNTPDGNFQAVMSTEVSTTTIDDNGITIDGTGLTQKYNDSSTDGDVTYGLEKFTDTSYDTRVLNYQDVKEVVKRCYFNLHDHGTIYNYTDPIDISKWDKDSQWASGGFKYGGDRFLTYADLMFDHGPNGDNGPAAQYLIDGLEQFMEQHTEEMVNSVLKYLGIDPSKLPTPNNPGAGGAAQGN